MNEYDVLKNSKLLFEGVDFRNCGPNKNLFCPKMEEVNDELTYTFEDYREIYTTNTKFEVGDIDDTYPFFVERIKKILGSQLHRVSIYNTKLGLREILYNPLNLPPPPLPKRRNTTTTSSYDKILQQHSLTHKQWSQITQEELVKANDMVKNELLDKHIRHFKDDKYCALLQHANLEGIPKALFQNIIRHYMQAGLRPCISLSEVLVAPELFKLYPEKDRQAYFIENAKQLDKPHDYLPFINVKEVPFTILKYIANRSPSEFIKISWDNMTLDRFKKELNPFMQIEYLKKFGPNYHTTAKYKALHDSITDPKVMEEPEYKFRLKFGTDLVPTYTVKECMEKYSINDLIDMAQKKFGGTKNSYLSMTHATLCDLIEKKHVKIPTKKPTKGNYNYITDEHYLKTLHNQIQFVDSLDPKTKDGLQRYTHQFDWQVNQVLKSDKPIVKSLEHPNASDEDGFDVNKLEYGYKHVLNKNIKDVQRHLDAAFAHVPPLKHTLVVYRGIKYNKSVHYSHEPVYNKQYLSTTTDQDVAESFLDDFACCVLHITLPQGTHVLPLMRVSHYPNEFEVLLPRNGELQVYKQTGNDVYAHFYERPQTTVKPVRVFDEHMTHVNIKFKGPKYVQSIIAGTMGPGINNGQEYNYTIKQEGMPYIVKKLPFIVMLKKLSQDYPQIYIDYTAHTDKMMHDFIIEKGTVKENGKIVKFTGGVGGGRLMLPAMKAVSPKRVASPQKRVILKAKSAKAVGSPKKAVKRNTIVQKAVVASPKKVVKRNTVVHKVASPKKIVQKAVSPKVRNTVVNKPIVKKNNGPVNITSPKLKKSPKKQTVLQKIKNLVKK